MSCVDSSYPWGFESSLYWWNKQRWWNN